MEEKYYGLNGQFIPRSEVPFDFKTLKNMDNIENQEKTAYLYYFEKEEAYRLITNDPSRYLSVAQLQQNWRKL